jgi:putative peptidoglycan lipid II flippase
LIGLWWFGAQYYPILGLQDANVREVGRLMAPRVLGLAAVQLHFWINTVLASTLMPGSLSALNFAWLLMLLPQGIVAQAVATAAFPTFAALEASGRLAELRQLVTNTLRGVLFLSIPAAVGLLIWRTPLIRMLLERGAFTPESTQLTAAALAFYSLGLIGHSVVEIVTRAFYALHDTRTPVGIGIAAMGLNVALSLVLIMPMAHAGLALANTLATTAEMALLCWFLGRRFDGLGWGALGGVTAKAALASAIMAVPLLIMNRQWEDGPAILIGMAGLMVGGLTYLLAAAALRMPEVAVLRRLAARGG